METNNKLWEEKDKFLGIRGKLIQKKQKKNFVNQCLHNMLRVKGMVKRLLKKHNKHLEKKDITNETIHIFKEKTITVGMVDEMSQTEDTSGLESSEGISLSIDMSGNRQMEKFQKASKFITLMGISKIIESKTYNAYQIQNTKNSTHNQRVSREDLLNVEVIK